MKILFAGIVTTSLALLSACGADTEESNLSQESNLAQEPEQSQQGILTNSQQQALEAARGVEQTLLDSAADREKELEARLKTL